MAPASIVLGIVAFIFMVLGFLTTGIPVVGSVFSFGSPVLALAGIITAGIAMSRAKEVGESSGAATAGLIISIVSFLLGLVVALTCGLCNACATTAAHQTGQQLPQLQRDLQQAGQQFEQQMQQQQQARMRASRLEFASMIDQIRVGCQADPTGAATVAFYLPRRAATIQAEACSVTEQTAIAIRQECPAAGPCSNASRLAIGTPDAQLLSDAGIIAAQCTVFTSGQAKLIGCNTGGRYQIAHLENAAAVGSNAAPNNGAPTGTPQPATPVAPPGTPQPATPVAPAPAPDPSAAPTGTTP